LGGERGYIEVVRIASAGAGRIGGNASLLWSSAGHDVVISSPRQAPRPSSHRPWWSTRSVPTRPIDRGRRASVMGTAGAAATQAVLVIHQIRMTERVHGGRLDEEVAP
jgi:predicted dinucleotide-binding enzyme